MVIGALALAAGVLVTKTLWPSEVLVPGPSPAPTIIDVTIETRAAYEQQIADLNAAVGEARESAADLPNLIDTVFVDSIVRIPIPVPAEDSTGVGASSPVLPGRWYPLRAAIADKAGEESVLLSRRIEVWPTEVLMQDKTEQYFTPGPLRGFESDSLGVYLYFDDSFPSRSCSIFTKIGWGLGGVGFGTILGLTFSVATP